MRKKLLLFLSVLLGATALAAAQPRTVTGTVTSGEDGSPMIQLTVLVKGTATGVVTDMDGRYSIKAPGPDAVLLFKYTGYQSQEILVGEQAKIDVVMQPSMEEIDEVMVVGYGTRGKNRVTGSTQQVSGKKLAAVPVLSPIEALQGQVPGMTTNTTSGTPGSSQQVRIRGIGSMAGGVTPLYVIDGVPVTMDVYGSSSGSTLGGISSLSNSDIASVTVLKDASATAAYGARGSNGVIVITTKKGQSGQDCTMPTRFSFSGYWGVSKRAMYGIEMMTPEQMLETEALWRRNGAFMAALGKNPALKAEYMTGTLSDAAMEQVNALWGKVKTVEKYQELMLQVLPGWKKWDEDGRPSYNWEEAMLRDLAQTVNAQLSASGGGKGYDFYSSFASNYTQNTVRNSDYYRMNGTLNFNKQLTSWLKFSTKNNVSYSKQDGLLSEQGLYFSNPMMARFFKSPMTPLKDEDGNNWTAGTIYNYLETSKYDVVWQSLLRGMSNSSLEATILPGLKYKTRLSLDYAFNDRKQYQNKTYGDGQKKKGTSSRTMAYDYTYVLQNSLSYDFTLADSHVFSVMALAEWQKNKFNDLEGYGVSTIDDKLTDLNSMADEYNAASSFSDWANAAYLGMINYSYEGRYIVDLTYRLEGSSRFPKDKRFGSFGSVGLAWNVSQEPFFESARQWVNNLKLRGSWGISGNSNIGLNKYQSFLAGGALYNGRPGLTLSGYGNPDLTWEKNSTFDVGFDLGVMNRANVSFSYFRKRTYDLLQNVPLPYTTGFGSIAKNVGEMLNSGFEVLVSGDILRGDQYLLSMSANVATLHNEVTKLAKDAAGNTIEMEGSLKKTAEGHMYNEYFLKQWAGVSAQTGLPLWYTDESRTATTTDINKAQKVWTGYSAIPKITAGLTLHAEAWGVYLDANLYFAGGHKITNTLNSEFFRADDLGVIMSIGGGLEKYLYQNTWSHPGDDCQNSMLAKGFNSNGSSYESDRWLYDGDYIRLKGVTLGYNIPKSLLKRIGYPGSISVYARGTNLFTHAFDKDVDFDPEVRLTGNFAMVNPPSSVYTVGVNLNF